MLWFKRLVTGNIICHIEFILPSDHQTLQYLSAQKKSARHVLSNELEHYTYVSKHKPGKENADVDALRMLPQEPEISTLIVLRPFIDDLGPLRDLYSSDPEFDKITTECKDGNNFIGKFTLQDGFLFRGPQLRIPTSLLCLKVIWEVHSDRLGCHFGVAKTLQLLRGKYFRPTMRLDTTNLHVSVILVI